MADFCITAVHYDDDPKNISYVQVREEQETTVGAPRVVSRAFIADLIRLRKATFITRTEENDGWKYGAEVHLIDGEYLTTDRNRTKRDNLGSLPKF